MTKTYKDPCSQSNPDFYALTHIDIDWEINFNKKIINALCGLTFELRNDNSKTIVSTLSIVL